MRMPALARSLMIGALAVLSVGSAGCSAAYIQELTNWSPVRADMAVPGKVDWKITYDEFGEIKTTESTRTDPSITLTLDANSAPVNYTTAQADFFYTEGTTNDANKLVTNALTDVPTQYFPFATQLKTIDRATEPLTKTIVLHGLIPTKLIDITNPKAEGYQRLTAVVATVKLTGTNGFGARVTTTVNVPINIDY